MLYHYRKYKKGEFFLLGVDTSAGGADSTAGQFLSKTKLDVPTVLHERTSITALTPIIHTELELIYDQTGIQPVVAYERQNGGVFELERLGTLNRNGKYKIYTMPTYGSTDNAESKKIGWDTNTATRPKMLQDLREVINKNSITLYHKPTINELFTFILSPNGKPQAEVNSHDDLVMALAVAWQLYQTENPVAKVNNYSLPQFQPIQDEDLGL